MGVKQHSTNRTQTELRGSVKVEVAVLGQGSPAEIKSREVELGSPRELDNPLLQLFLNSCFSNTVLVTLFRTAVETAVISGVHKLLRTGGVPTSLTLLFWLWLTVSSVFVGRGAWTSYSRLYPWTYKYICRSRNLT